MGVGGDPLVVLLLLSTSLSLLPCAHIKWRQPSVENFREEILLKGGRVESPNDGHLLGSYSIPHDHYRCTDHCECYNSTLSTGEVRIHVDCSSSKYGHRPETNTRYRQPIQSVISDILAELPATIYSLDLSNNYVGILHTDDFARFTRLTTMIVSNASINVLNDMACQHDLPSLNRLYLSHNNLGNISDGALACLTNLTTLSLRFNSIHTIWNNSLAGLQRLNYLYLAYNDLRTIQPGAFGHVTELLELDLSGNVHFTLSKKYAETFSSLTSLKAFHLEGCDSYGGRYPAEVLTRLTALEELSMNGEKSSFQEYSLASLQNLTKVSLGTYGYCWTKNFTSTYFQGLPSLTEIQIGYCKNAVLSSQIFETNSKLSSIVITSTRLTLSSILSSFCGLHNHSISSISVSNTSGSRFDPPISLGKKDSVCLEHMSNLQHLSLEYNGVFHLDIEFVRALPKSLSSLSVRGNYQTAYKSVLPYVIYLQDSFPRLAKLNEDFQGQIYKPKAVEENDKTREASDDVLLFSSSSGSTSIHSLQMPRDDEDFKDVWNGVPTHYVDKFSHAHNDWEKLEKQQQASEQNQARMKNNLTLEVYTASNSVNFGTNLLSNKLLATNLRVLNLSTTLITDWGLSAHGKIPQGVQVADLSHNYCEKFSPHFFDVNNSLVELHLSGNYLGPFLDQYGDGTLLAGLSCLRYLDLSRNHLYNLPWHSFDALAKLEVLRLDTNNLNFLDIHVSHMKSLRFLDVTKNSIRDISGRTKSELDSLAQSGQQLGIHLGANPLPCTCHGLELLTWLRDTHVRIVDKDFLICIDEKNVQFDLKDLATTVERLQRECVSNKILALSLAFSTTILLIFICTVWAFQNRWRIKYMYNLAISRSSGFQPVARTNDCIDNDEDSDECSDDGLRQHQNIYPANQLNVASPPFIFDAFFVYRGGPARDFVLDKVLPELEANRGHCVCVEDRDFLVGSYIPCNITSAVRTSRTTVVVVDEDYRAEGWPHYAVEMARVEAVVSNRNVLHLLVLGSLPTEVNLPSAYLKVARDGAVSEVPPAQCGSLMMAMFWDSLSRTIGHCVRQGRDRRLRRPHPQLRLVD